MKSNKEADAIVEHYLVKCDKVFPDGSSAEDIDRDLREPIRKLERERDEARAGLRWIPVPERSPDAQYDVLITDGTRIGIGDCHKGHLWNTPCDFGIVTHWMPLPPAPKEEPQSSDFDPVAFYNRHYVEEFKRQSDSFQAIFVARQMEVEKVAIRALAAEAERRGKLKAAKIAENCGTLGNAQTIAAEIRATIKREDK